MKGEQQVKDTETRAALLGAMNALRRNRPGDRSEKDRQYSPMISDMELVLARFETFVNEDDRSFAPAQNDQSGHPYGVPPSTEGGHPCRVTPSR